MPDKYTYLLINVGSVIVPFAFSFHRKIQFVGQWKAFWPALIITALIFILWDILFTYLGIWGFNERYLTGARIYNLPLEETLFFLCIPYSSMFTYYWFEKMKFNLTWLNTKWISFVLSLSLLLTGIVFLNVLYTSVTFIALAVLLFYLQFVKRVEWISNFYLMFVFILIPFFIVNGILTGTGPDEPVVWYNDEYNLGIRLLTIPIEDVFYGMLLLLINTSLFEHFRKEYAR